MKYTGLLPSLYAAVLSLERVCKNEVGLSAIHWHVMALLRDKDRQPAGALARQLGRAETAFTPVIDKLERLGYVYRSESNGDRRQTIICLTDAGKAWLKDKPSDPDFYMPYVDTLDFDDFDIVLTKLQEWEGLAW